MQRLRGETMTREEKVKQAMLSRELAALKLNLEEKQGEVARIGQVRDASFCPPMTREERVAAVMHKQRSEKAAALESQLQEALAASARGRGELQQAQQQLRTVNIWPWLLTNISR